MDCGPKVGEACMVMCLCGLSLYVCVCFTDCCGQASNVSFLLQLGYEHLSTLWYCELQAGIFSKQKGDQHTLRLNYCIIELLKQTQTVLCSGPAYEDSLSDKN